LIVERVRRVFDLGANPEEISFHLGKDALLRPLIRRRPGIRLSLVWDPFEACIRAIVGQQISVKAATTILGRIAQECGKQVPFEEQGITRLFPDPAALAQAKLASAGLPAARLATIRDLARRVDGGKIVLSPETDADEIARNLREIPGIGEWTVSYVRLRGLGDPDVLLSQDLGVRKALAANGKLPKSSAIEKRAESWRPWRSYAVLHLWAMNGEGAESSPPARRSGRKGNGK
jgi:AraC family transcriptional regulator of adaptative response / DNA-3-methyladenine glycosylase II